MSDDERDGACAGPRDESGDAGYVTAEAALVIPVLVVITGMLLWGVMVACAQIQCVDAARAGARAAARQETPGAVDVVARTAAPRGARVALTRDGDLVRVRVDAASPGVGPLTLGLRGEATALAEETVG